MRMGKEGIKVSRIVADSYVKLDRPMYNPEWNSRSGFAFFDNSERQRSQPSSLGSSHLVFPNWNLVSKFSQAAL